MFICLFFVVIVCQYNQIAHTNVYHFLLICQFVLLKDYDKEVNVQSNLTHTTVTTRSTMYSYSDVELLQPS